MTMTSSLGPQVFHLKPAIHVTFVIVFVQDVCVVSERNVDASDGSLDRMDG